MNEFIKLEEGYYEMVLLWWKYFLELLNNKFLVEYCLKLLKCRLMKDLLFYGKYIELMDDFFCKGYVKGVYIV